MDFFWRSVFFLTLILIAPSLLGADSYPRLEPKKDGYFGLNIDWANDTPKKVVKRFGFKPAVYVRFFPFPMDDDAIATLKSTAKLVKKQKAMLLLTLEPWQGLSSVTDEEAERHAIIFKRARIKIFIRFAHEMNGSWYPWSQQPSAYIKAFVKLADAVHKVNRKKAAMIWAPNYVCLRVSCLF